jgi:hypothetical protein
MEGLRTSDRLRCKSLVKRKARDSVRALESASCDRSRSAATHVCLSAGGSRIGAEPGIRLRSQAPRTCHRRLSCVLCQFRNNSKRASGVSSVALAVTCGTWQTAHRIILMFFPRRARGDGTDKLQGRHRCSGYGGAIKRLGIMTGNTEVR